MQIGFSTGSLFFQKTSIADSLDLIAQVETDAAEINFGKPEELLSLSTQELSIITERSKNFQSISLHAPFRDVLYDKDAERLLASLFEVAQQTQAEYVVFHPDTIQDHQMLETTLGSLVAVENMDVRKSVGKNVLDMQRIFSLLPNAKFLLDLNHIFTVDPTMKLAEEFYSAFSERLIGYHISGYGNETLLHTLLYQTNELEILGAIPNRTLRAIHEGTVSSLEELKKEYSFVQQFLDLSAS